LALRGPRPDCDTTVTGCQIIAAIAARLLKPEDFGLVAIVTVD
jgi:hypothetical protein